MKRLIASGLSLATYLSYALPAFAQTSVDPCPNKESGPWGDLCNFGADGNSIDAIISNSITAVLIIATVIALFFLIWGGVKWVMSGGDKAKVDSARGTIIAAVIGLIVAFLSFFIINIVLSMFGLSFANLSIPKIIQ